MAEYKVVTSDYPEKLSEEVTRLLGEGWSVAGGVSCSLSESDDYRFEMYAQAMMKVSVNVVSSVSVVEGDKVWLSEKINEFGALNE